ncbi:hypothetical protein FHL15_009311 [Xylaria flabelliformis]|uniref:Uncharacterized protein n=1 Tax=Xylaria flabelliformis TaxID=2512241 RepID=A0A553HP39_9PEZI|nr:hypothetical protein FHL15_009311 [Xylaria flabelliformis]
MTYFMGFAEPTFALAAHFPELDPIALLQLVEAPVVRLAFYEFRSRFWDRLKRVDPAQTHIKLVERALNLFGENPEGINRLSVIGGGDCSSPDNYQTCDSFYAFMSRVYAWATSQDYLDLPIRRNLENKILSASLLWGILGICISIHEDGNFPEPLLPLPTEEFQHVEGELTPDDVKAWKVNTRALCYTPPYFPLWQEWRARHQTLRDEYHGANWASAWIARVTKDYSMGPDNAIDEAYDWLQIIKIARVYRDMQHKVEARTKYCAFELQI